MRLRPALLVALLCGAWASGSRPQLAVERRSAADARAASLVRDVVRYPQPPRRALLLRGGAMSVKQGWSILFISTLFELASTCFMHYARGFTRPVWSALAVIFYLSSFVLFNISLRALEISIAYAVWSAVVMAALAAVGMTFLGETVNAAKVIGIVTVGIGTVCLSAQSAGA